MSYASSFYETFYPIYFCNSHTDLHHLCGSQPSAFVCVFPVIWIHGFMAKMVMELLEAYRYLFFYYQDHDASEFAFLFFFFHFFNAITNRFPQAFITYS